MVGSGGYEEDTVRIGFDARALSDHFPGIGRYIHSLLLALQPELEDATLVVLYDPQSSRARADLAPLAVLPGVQTVPLTSELRGPLQRRALPRLIREYGVDVFHAPYYLGAGPGLPCPLVLSLFDVIPLACRGAMPRLLDRLAYRVAVGAALGAARRVIVPSEASRTDLARFFRGAEQRAVVIPCAAASQFAPAAPGAVQQVRERYGLPPRYILHVGTNKPHKNLETLLAAYAHYAGATAAAERAGLVLAGAHSPRHLDVPAWATAHGLGEAVQALGAVPEGDLPALCSGAACVAVPSLYEGFGLPVLEAMACDTPVLCANASSLPEVAGDAALVLEPRDAAAWADALRALLAAPELQASMRARGLAHAGRFSWAAAALSTLQVYREIADSHW